MPNSEQKSLEFIIFELLPIVCDQCVRNAESIDEFFPEEMLNPSLSDGQNDFYFYPLCEVVYGYD